MRTPHIYMSQLNAKAKYKQIRCFSMLHPICEIARNQFFSRNAGSFLSGYNIVHLLINIHKGSKPICVSNVNAITILCTR